MIGGTLISGLYVVQRIIAISPEIHTGTLYSMQSDGSYPVSGVAWTYKLDPLSIADTVLGGVETDNKDTDFILLDESTSGKTAPKDGDKWVDEDGQAWTIQPRIKTDMFKRIHHITAQVQR